MTLIETAISAESILLFDSTGAGLKYYWISNNNFDYSRSLFNSSLLSPELFKSVKQF